MLRQLIFARAFDFFELTKQIDYAILFSKKEVIFTNDRIKTLRKALKLTQEEFGSKVGLSRAEVSNIEIGRAPVRPATIPVICSVLGVNREWLEMGHGEMFVSDDAAILSRLVSEYDLSSAEAAAVSTFLRLVPQDRAAILRYVKALASELESAIDPDEAEAEAVKQEYLLQKRAAAGSSATAGQDGEERRA